MLFTFSCPALNCKFYCILSNNNHSHSPALTICQVLFFYNSEVGIVIPRRKQRGGDMAKVTELGNGRARFGARFSHYRPLWLDSPVPNSLSPLSDRHRVHSSVAESSQKIAVQLEGAPAQGFQPCLGLGSPSAGSWPCASGQRSWDSDQRQKTSTCPAHF